MKDLGGLYKQVWDSIRQATQRGDASAIKALGSIADDMDHKYEEWSARVQGTAPNRADASGGSSSNGSQPAPDRQAPSDYSPGTYTGRPIRGFQFGAEHCQ